MLKKIAAAAVAGAAFLTVLPSSASASWGKYNRVSYENAVDFVVTKSGAPGDGFDRRGWDYDILREALVATELVDAVASAEDITVFAPTDRAFVRLARQLGYDGWSEQEAFGVIAEATGYVSPTEPGLLDDVLLYHVAPEGQTVRELRRAGDIATLLADSTVKVSKWGRVIDADTDDRDAYISWWARDIKTGNGVVQSVNQVLRPIDLP